MSLEYTNIFTVEDKVLAVNSSSDTETISEAYESFVDRTELDLMDECETKLRISKSFIKELNKEGVDVTHIFESELTVVEYLILFMNIVKAQFEYEGGNLEYEILDPLEDYYHIGGATLD